MIFTSILPWMLRTAIAALPGEGNGKNRSEAERKLKSNLYQRDNETFEKFHAELIALTGRCDFDNDAENIRDNLIINMRKSDCQKDLSQSSKSPEEVY